MEQEAELWKVMGLLAFIFGFCGYYGFLVFSIIRKLKRDFPEYWNNLTYRPESQIGKSFFLLGGWGISMDMSAVYNFFMKKKYYELNDELLIKYGMQARFMAVSWISIFIGFIFFMWISSLVRHCKGSAPEGFAAVWECLINIP